MVVYGAATLGCAGAGYLIGPIIGSALWRFMNRNTMRLIEARDKEFHNHIVKNRVDPAAQSATNPVPDFYGQLQHLFVRPRNSQEIYHTQVKRSGLCTITDRCVIYEFRVFEGYIHRSYSG